jgi:hypothetical protein
MPTAGPHRPEFCKWVTKIRHFSSPFFSISCEEIFRLDRRSQRLPCVRKGFHPMHIFLSFLVDTTGGHTPIIIDAIVKAIGALLGL